MVPWEREVLEGSLNIRWVLPAGRDWKIDSCHTFSTHVETVTVEDSDSSETSDLSGTPASLKTSSPQTTTVISTSVRKTSKKLRFQDVGYGLTLPVIIGSGKVESKKSSTVSKVDLLCNIRTTNISTGTIFGENNSEVDIKYGNGIGNIRNGRMIIKPSPFPFGSIEFYGSGNLQAPGRGFIFAGRGGDHPISGIRFCASNFLAEFGMNHSGGKDHTCQLSLENNGVTTEYRVEGTVDSEPPNPSYGNTTNSLFNLASTLVPLTGNTPVDGSVGEYLAKSSTFRLVCPTLGVQKRYPGVPTVMMIQAVDQKSDVGMSAHIQMENSATALHLATTVSIFFLACLALMF